MGEECQLRVLGLIGGTGLDDWGGETLVHDISSDYGQASGDVAEYPLGDLKILFMPRHGPAHSIAPHAVNYRANIDVLRKAGVDAIVAVNAVGGISEHCRPGTIHVPDQLIDYTWGRKHSFSLNADDHLQHIEFAEPFGGNLRKRIINAGPQSGVRLTEGGCLAVCQGPRLETAAEIRRLQKDGADLVGMTSMPEAALAREAGVDYASICVVANRAAGLGDEPVSMDAIDTTLKHAMVNVRTLLHALVKDLSRAD